MCRDLIVFFMLLIILSGMTSGVWRDYMYVRSSCFPFSSQPLSDVTQISIFPIFYNNVTAWNVIVRKTPEYLSSWFFFIYMRRKYKNRQYLRKDNTLNLVGWVSDNFKMKLGLNIFQLFYFVKTLHKIRQKMIKKIKATFS